MILLRDKLKFGLLPLVARISLAAEFVIAAHGKATGWSDQAAYMASHGMTMIPLLLGAALAVEVVGSLCLMTGFNARGAAAILCVYLGIVSLRLHDFWNIVNPMAAGGAQTQFFKNVGMMGGLLMVAAYGPGRWALGARKESS
jgi:putative oxidoreductase